MGCLKVDISFAGGVPGVSVREKSDLSFSVSAVKRNICRCVKALLRCVNDLFVSVYATNDSFDVNIACASSKPVVELGLVCMTDLDTEYYLQVLDGDLITVDGCYMKVTKA